MVRPTFCASTVQRRSLAFKFHQRLVIACKQNGSPTLQSNMSVLSDVTSIGMSHPHGPVCARSGSTDLLLWSLCSHGPVLLIFCPRADLCSPRSLHSSVMVRSGSAGVVCECAELLNARQWIKSVANKVKRALSSMFVRAFVRFCQASTADTSVSEQEALAGRDCLRLSQRRARPRTTRIEQVLVAKEGHQEAQGRQGSGR